MNRLARLSARWDELHAQLQNDYRGPDGLRPAECAHIAVELGSLLRASGTRVQKHVITPVQQEPSDPIYLLPLPYRNRAEQPALRWRHHVVCVSEQDVYDPMLAVPVSRGEYIDLAFNQPVEMARTFWTRDDINCPY